MKVTLNRGLFRWIIVFLVGLAVFVFGSVLRHRYIHAKELGDLTFEELKTGTYYTGDITDYLVSNKQSASAELVLASKDYKFYTVPVANGKYIRVAIASREKTDQLDYLRTNEDNPLKFVGRVIEAPISLNSEWYEAVPGIDIHLVEPTYVLMESDYEPILKIGYYGLGIMVIGAIFLIAGLNHYVHSVNGKDLVTDPLPSHMSPEMEYISEQKTYDILEQRLKDKHRSFRLFLTIFVLSLLAFIAPYSFMNTKILWLIISVISCYSSCRSLLHFDNKTCRKISLVFGIDSVGVRMQAVRDNMQRLKEKIAQK